MKINSFYFFWAAGRAFATRSFSAATPAEKGAQTMALSLLQHGLS
jgi:hypothetical protein